MLMIKSDFLLRRRHGIHVASRRAGRTSVAVHFHIAAERQPRHFPARPVLVGAPENLPPETDGARLDFYAAAPCHPVVAELMHEHDDADDGEKRQDIVKDSMKNVFHEALSLTR